MKIQKKKILLVTPYFYPQTGGLENYAYHIAKGLKEKYGWETVIVTSNHEENKYREEKLKGLKIYRLAPWFKISNTPVNPIWFFQIKKIIKKEKPDLINAHAPVPFITDASALVCGDIPFVLTYHAGTMKKNIFLLDIIIFLYENTLLKFTAKKAKKIICASEFVKRTVFAKFSNKCVVIHPAVDVDIFKPLKESNKPRKEKKILFICRYAKMAKMKGLYDLVEAMNMVLNAKLKIIGEKGEIKCRKIEYLGIKTGNDLVKEIQTSNVLVLPSLAHMESFGMVLIEAMACRIPVIGTNIGGIPEVINNGIDGIIVPPNSPNKLANAINKILTDDKLAERMAGKGYEKVQKHHIWDHQIEITERLLSSILN